MSRGVGGVQALATRAAIAATDAIARLIEACFNAHPCALVTKKSIFQAAAGLSAKSEDGPAAATGIRS
jgi:hypothetical protein